MMNMTFDMDHAIAILSRTPRVLEGLLDGLSDAWLHANRGEKSFSPFDVIGHLIQGEKTDWIPRVMIILRDGEARAFEPFDRFAQLEESQGKTTRELLETFSALRAVNLNTLRELRLTDADLDRRGKHPALGVVTMRELLSTWVVHDLNHLMQIARTLAWQYRDNVGPWRAYLSILNDD